MKDVFTFYRAVDPMKGSWDGYGHFPMESDNFIALVTDAPSGASIHTPELIKEFWKTFAENAGPQDFPVVQLSDALNRLQYDLQQKARRDNTLYQATIALAWKSGRSLFYCCIGDSALHLFRNGKLFRLNESEIWDGALITPPDRNLKDRQRTAELRFIGSSGSFVSSNEIHTLELKPQDILIFSTDGVEDLLPPDRMLAIIGENSGPDSLRQKLETIFVQDKVKDDATLLIVPASVSPAFDSQKEIAALKAHLDKLEKGQTETRNQLMDLSQTKARLVKIEATLHQVSQDLKHSAKRSQPVFHNQPSTAARPGVSARKPQRLPWLIPLICLIAGTAAGAFFFQRREIQPQPQPVVQQKAPNAKRIVAPPEIPSGEDCNYTIQKGDSLDKIASARNITIDQLLTWNPSQKKNAPLVIGTSLTVCGETQ